MSLDGEIGGQSGTSTGAGGGGAKPGKAGVSQSISRGLNSFRGNAPFDISRKQRPVHCDQLRRLQRHRRQPMRSGCNTKRISQQSHLIVAAGFRQLIREVAKVIYDQHVR